MMRPFSLRRALRKLDLLAATMDPAADSVCIVDADGQICLLNPAAERVFGWTEAEVLGQDFHSVMHRCDDTKQREGCALYEASHARAPFRRSDETLRRKDGSTIPVSYLATPIIVGGHVAGTILAINDRSHHEDAIQALQESEQRYRCLAEASPEPMWLTDQYGYITVANSGAAELFGCSTWGNLVQLNVLELFALEDRPRATQAKHNAGYDGTTGRYHLLRGVGARTAAVLRPPFPADVRISARLDADGRLLGHLYAAHDRTQTAQEDSESTPTQVMPLEHAIALALSGSAMMSDTIPHLLQTVCEHSGWDLGAYWQVDTDDQLLRCHTFWQQPGVQVEAFQELSQQLAFAPGVDLPGRVWTRNEVVWIPDMVADNDMMRSLAASKDGLHGAFSFPISVGGAMQGVMEFMSHQVRPADAALMEAADSASAQIGWFLERHHAEKALRHKALHDTLTGLPNRALLLDRLRRALFVARETGKPLALFLIDLDHFKVVNDVHGDGAGDDLLVQVARRLHSVLRDSDTVARLGGDEFAVLLPSTAEVGAIIVADKIVAALRDPFWVDGVHLDTVGGSIGIALYPDHGKDPMELLQSADAAMYVAKRRGTGHAVYHFEGQVSPELAPAQSEALSR